MADVPKCEEEKCCSSCDGTGRGYESETNGLCWDCYGTGHAHPQENDGPVNDRAVVSSRMIGKFSESRGRVIP